MIRQTESMGRGMLFLACILGMVLLTFFFGEVEERQYNPNQDPESRTSGNRTEVNLVRNKRGHYVVTGTINDQAVTFLLDTGATDVAVPGSLSDQLGLQRGLAGQAKTANGLVTVYHTRIDKLTISDITLYQVNASIIPAMDEGNLAGLNREVLLGMSALKQVEFIQRGNMLTLRQVQE